MERVESLQLKYGWEVEGDTFKDEILTSKDWSHERERTWTFQESFRTWNGKRGNFAGVSIVIHKCLPQSWWMMSSLMSVDICHVYVESFANDHGKVWPNHRHCRRLPEILPLIENMIIMLCYFCLLQVGDKISRKQQDKMKSFHLVQQVFSKSEIVRMTVSSNQELFISSIWRLVRCIGTWAWYKISGLE